jgi:Zn-dependent peptidase ImmA (M78 family)/transcriptional regulator with XRE-family HTH domain
MISDRVRNARLYHGWSQTELAQHVGTTQPKISQMESGDYTSSELLDAIASATQYSRTWFEQGPLPDLPTGTLRFRKQASSSVKNDERVRAHVRQAVEVIEKFSGLPQAPKVRLAPIDPNQDCSADAIEGIAQDVREQLGVGPLDPIPNLVRAVERAGVAVIGSIIDIEFGQHSGASYWPDYPFGRPIICISRGMPGDRQRFTTAHELGHLVLHQWRNPEAKIAELEANRFAGALLIPRDAMMEIDTPVTLRTLAHVKARWGISIRALVRRSLDVHLVDTAHRISLEKQISSRKWNRQEPVEVPYEQPRLVGRLIELGSGTKGFASSTRLGLPPLAIRDLVA